MKTNLRHKIKQTPLPKWKPLIPLFEAVMNSIQAVRDAHRPKGTGNILIDIEREHELLQEDHPAMTSFTITDNGIGLDDANFDSFNTAYSDYKEKVGGKGLGRFTWLKAFEKAEVSSTFLPKGEQALHRKFVFHERYDADDGIPTALSGA